MRLRGDANCPASVDDNRTLPTHRHQLTSALSACGLSAGFGVESPAQPGHELPSEHGPAGGHRLIPEGDGRLTLVIITIDGGVVNTSGQAQDVAWLVDIANVMGSRPDGWWRDRAGAATRLLNGLEPLNGAEVTLPAGLGTVRISEVRAVVEGATKRAGGPVAVSVLASIGTAIARSSSLSLIHI